MTSENTSSGPAPLSQEAGFAKQIAEFVDFLNDDKPPLFVANSLSTILRTEPPIQFSPQKVSDIVASWAEKRAAGAGKTVSQMMLDATRKIIEAYRAGTVQGFDPKLFYRPFVLSLTARVPIDQRESFQVGLKGMQESLPRRWANKQESEFEDTESVEIRGERMTHESAVNILLDRLEKNPHMPADEYEETMRDLENVLSSRVGISVHQILERIARIGIKYFEIGLVPRASQLFEEVHDSFDRLHIAKDKREEIKNAIPSGYLDRAVFSRWASDSDNFLLLQPILQFFPDFTVVEALKRVADEKARDRRKMYLSVLEIQGVEALPLVIQHLADQRVDENDWHYTRNLLYLVSRIEPPAEDDRRRVLDLVGHFSTSGNPQLRQAAVSALARIGGREVIPYLTRALEPLELPEPQNDEEKDALKAHAKQVVEVLAGMDSEAAVALATEVAVGQRAVDFGFGKELRDAAIQALMARTKPLPRRAALVFVGFLRQQGEKKLKIVVGNLGIGVDIPGSRAAVKLLSDSPEPESKEVLDSPFARKIASRGTAELMSMAGSDEH